MQRVLRTSLIESRAEFSLVIARSYGTADSGITIPYDFSPLHFFDEVEVYSDGRAGRISSA